MTYRSKQRRKARAAGYDYPASYRPFDEISGPSALDEEIEAMGLFPNPLLDATREQYKPQRIPKKAILCPGCAAEVLFADLDKLCGKKNPLLGPVPHGYWIPKKYIRKLAAQNHLDALR